MHQILTEYPKNYGTRRRTEVNYYESSDSENEKERLLRRKIAKDMKKTAFKGEKVEVKINHDHLEALLDWRNEEEKVVKNFRYIEGDFMEDDELDLKPIQGCYISPKMKEYPVDLVLL